MLASLAFFVLQGQIVSIYFGIFPLSWHLPGAGVPSNAIGIFGAEPPSKWYASEEAIWEIQGYEQYVAALANSDIQKLANF